MIYARTLMIERWHILRDAVHNARPRAALCGYTPRYGGWTATLDAWDEHLGALCVRCYASRGKHEDRRARPSPVAAEDHAFEGDGSADPTWCSCGRSISEHLRH